MAKRTKTIRWTEEISFYDARILGANAISPLQTIYTLTRDITIRPKHIVMSGGIRDDPIDEVITWILGQTDPDSLPDILEPWVESSIWNKTITWKSIGTDSGPTEVQDDNEESILDTVHSKGETDEPSGLVLTVHSSTTSSILTLGTILIDVEYRQATYNNSDAPASEIERQTLW